MSGAVQAPDMGEPFTLYDPARLAQVGPLLEGSHEGPDAGMCVMEAVAYVAGEPWSDHPSCACPVIGAFLRAWNDGLPDDERDALLRPLIPRLVGTKGDGALEERRSLMAADWLVREHTPAWMRLAGLTAQADTLAGLPEITSMAQVPGIRPAIEAAQRDAETAWAAAGDAARDAAWAAARAAARDAARAAALMARVLVCDGLPLDPTHVAHAAARMDVWRRGYGLYADVAGTLYVYRRIA